MLVLHNLSEELKQDFIEFSKKCPEKSMKTLIRYWNQARYDDLGMGSLCHWAKNDNPEKYAIEQLQYVIDVFNQIILLSNYDVAQLLYVLYGDR